MGDHTHYLPQQTHLRVSQCEISVPWKQFRTSCAESGGTINNMVRVVFRLSARLKRLINSMSKARAIQFGD